MLEKPPVTIIDHANGGKGRIILEHIAGPETLRENARLFVKATLEKGCSMGVHKHKATARSTTSSPAKPSTPTTTRPTK